MFRLYFSFLSAPVTTGSLALRVCAGSIEGIREV